MLHEDGTPMTEQKIKELGDVRRGLQDTKKQGAVELGWATVHGSNRSIVYGNEKLRRKSMERNVETFDFTQRQFDVTLPN